MQRHILRCTRPNRGRCCDRRKNARSTTSRCWNCKRQYPLCRRGHYPQPPVPHFLAVRPKSEERMIATTLWSDCRWRHRSCRRRHNPPLRGAARRFRPSAIHIASEEQLLNTARHKAGSLSLLTSEAIEIASFKAREKSLCRIAVPFGSRMLRVAKPSQVGVT